MLLYFFAGLQADIEAAAAAGLLDGWGEWHGFQEVSSLLVLLRSGRIRKQPDMLKFHACTSCQLYVCSLKRRSIRHVDIAP
jgi:hypothetical protein